MTNKCNKKCSKCYKTADEHLRCKSYIERTIQQGYVYTGKDFPNYKNIFTLQKDDAGKKYLSRMESRRPQYPCSVVSLFGNTYEGIPINATIENLLD